MMFQRSENEHQNKHNQADDTGGANPRFQSEVGHKKGAEIIHQRETEGDGENSGIFATQNGFEMEGDIAFFKLAETRPESGNGHWPIQIGLTELAFKKPLFSIHNTFIIKPIDQRDDHKERQIENKDQQAEPHQVVTQVEGMPNDGVDAFGIQLFGNLFVGISSRGPVRRGSDGVCADNDAGEGNQDGESEDGALPAARHCREIQFRFVGQNQDGRTEDEDPNGHCAAVTEQPIAWRFERMKKCHKKKQ